MPRAWPLLLLAACAPEPTTVLVQVSCTPPESFAELRVRLRAPSLGVDVLRTWDADAGQPVSLPDRLVARFDDRAAEVLLDVEGTDLRGRARRASTTVTTAPHSRVSATLDVSLPPTCLNHARDPDESDVDCGGTSPCPRCAVASACQADADCDTRSCAADQTCELASGPPFWRPGAPLAIRTEFGLAVVPDAGITVVGGAASGGSPTLATVEVFDDTLGAFRSGVPLPAPQEGLGAAWVRDRLFAAGGTPSSRAVQSWAPGEAAWTTEPQLQYAHGEPAVGASGSRLYVFGGFESGNPSDRVEVLDGATWSSGHAMPTARVAPGVITGPTGTLFVIGGESGSGALTVVEEYHPAEDAWTSRPAMPSARYSFGAVAAPDGRLWAIGGDPAFGSSIDAVEAFDPTTDRWVAVPNLAQPRASCGAALLPDGRIMLVGGRNGGIQPDHAELYGPAVQLQPRTLRAGDALTLSGDNFAADAGVRAVLQPEGLVLGEGATDARGALPAPLSLTLPSVAAGRHAVVVVDDRSRYPVSITVEVTP